MAAGATGRVLALDGWRGTAITLVLIGHFYPVPGINLGLLGVEFFFVLSGRLMSELLFIKKYPLDEFFFRRATRILPALLYYLLVLGLVMASFGDPFSPLWMASAATFSINYAAAVQHYTPDWLGHLWSLCVEEHSYFILGLAALALGRGQARITLAIVLIAGLAMLDGAGSVWGAGQEVREVYWRSDVHIGSILCSAAVFLMLQKVRPKLQGGVWTSGVFLAALAIGVACNADGVPAPIAYSIGAICLALAVGLVDVAAPAIVRVFAFRPLVWMGVWSYSVYLWQEPFYHMAAKGFATPGLLLAAAFVPALISYYLVESPTRRVLNQLWPRIRQALDRKNMRPPPPVPPPLQLGA